MAVLLSLHVASIEAARESLGAVLAALEQLPGGVADSLTEGFTGGLVLGDEAAGLIRSEAVRDATGGTVEFQGLRVLPDERYLIFVSALAAHIGCDCIRVVHDWPVLSLVSGDSSVAETGGDATVPGGGLA